MNKTTAYIVQQDDTLWQIGEWYGVHWTTLAKFNNLKNPHLIYPGDEINLVYIDGKPALTVNRSHPTVKLGPEVRSISHDQAIETIPLKDIEPFLRELRILNKEDIDLAPYVVSAEEGRTISATGNLIYVRGLQNVRQGDHVAIVRPTVIYREIPLDYPWETSDRYKVESVEWKKSSPHTTDAVMSRFWKNYIDRTYWESVKVLGYEVADTGIAEVTRVNSGEVTTLKIIDSKTEVKSGDLVLPIDEFNYNPYFMPKAGTVDDENIRVVALNNALFGSGRRQIIAISNGYDQGVQVGDVYSVYSPEQVIRDEVMHPKNDLKTLFRPSKAKVTLPMEYSGHIMVFKTFENISYAIITEGNRQVKLYDYVKLP